MASCMSSKKIRNSGGGSPGPSFPPFENQECEVCEAGMEFGLDLLDVRLVTQAAYRNKSIWMNTSAVEFI